MAVAFDAATSPAASETVDFSWTHTPVGTPRGVVVWIVQGDDDNTDRINGVTYGGTAMTEVTGSPLLSPGLTDRGAVYCYFLGSSIPTGNQTVSVDTDGTAREKHALCVSLTASADTEIQDVDATINTTSATNPSVTLSLGGKTCWCGSGIRSGAGDVTNITPLTDWTSRLEHDYGSQVAGFYTYDIVGTSDVTAGWTQAAEDAQQIALAITEVAGAGAYELDADAVSFTWTTTAASLEFNREISADAVSWSWSPQAATVTKGIPLAADSVAWSWSPQAAAVEHGYEIAAGEVAWSWTITAAGLEHGYELVPDAVSWAWSPQAASLEHGHEIAAGSVAWSWTVGDAALIYGASITLEADGVAWQWSIGDVTLTYAPADAAPAVRPVGGIPLSYEEWARRKRKDEEEREEDQPPKPQVVELIGQITPESEIQPAPRSPELERALRNADALTGELTRSQLRRLQRKAKRRRADDEWFLLN